VILSMGSPKRSKIFRDKNAEQSLSLNLPQISKCSSPCRSPQKLLFLNVTKKCSRNYAQQHILLYRRTSSFCLCLPVLPAQHENRDKGRIKILQWVRVSLGSVVPPFFTTFTRLL